MARNVLGSLLALIGAAAAVWSPFRAWYDGRLGRYYEVGELFSGPGVTDARAELFLSLFLPFLGAALVVLAGVVFRSRPAVALAGLVVLGFTVLWMVRVGQALGELAVRGDGSGLGWGVVGALGGGLLILLGALVMAGRPKRSAAPAAQPPPPSTDTAETRTWDRPPDPPRPG
ncbi:hypothetical protein [Streptomyces sp. NPDC005955]|uniref:hypothetical protein n=1 Tax=Streptomyces sp. NPDC005955 TaxID=3364738 RepID=UPI00368CA07B